MSREKEIIISALINYKLYCLKGIEITNDEDLKEIYLNELSIVEEALDTAFTLEI